MRWPTILLLSAVLVGAPPARTAAAETEAREIPLFTVSKSQNRNVVQYAVHVDGQCAPAPDAPVFAFWRMNEKGPDVTEPLLAREQRAYGVASQVVTEQRPVGGSVRLVLNAVPKRPIVVQTIRASDGACRAYSTVSIEGTPAYLYNVFIRLKWLFGVDYLLLSGWSIDGSHVITEKVRD